MYLRDGSVQRFSRSLPIILRDYLGLWAFNKVLLQELYGDCESIIAPLAICHRHTMMPLRARIPQGKRDGAYGYVELESIMPVQVKVQSGSISLICAGHTLKFLCTKRHLRNMVAKAVGAAETYRLKNLQHISEPASAAYLHELTVIQGVVNQSMAKLCTIDN